MLSHGQGPELLLFRDTEATNPLYGASNAPKPIMPLSKLVPSSLRVPH